jgi:dTDP-4-dehydrorhamnose 3,5-epimerase
VQIEPTAIPDVKLITPKFFRDDRGYFVETYRADRLTAAGVDIAFVQDNQSLSVPVGTIRGLHFQTPPRAQDKLVRCIRGAILDVAVDIRRGSPTYGQHVAVRLSADDGLQLLVPKGFAHGFCTLEPDTEVVYKVSDYYAPECDRGLAWDDPALGIAWPVAAGAAVLSPKDRTHPRLADLPPAF